MERNPATPARAVYTPPGSSRGWVYFFGTADGKLVKIGYTAGTLGDRRKNLEQGQLSRVDLRLLAAVHGTRTHESEIKGHFADIRATVNSTEAYEPEPPLVEYVNWLRQQWWTAFEETDALDHVPAWPEWMPADDRRAGFPEDDPDALIQLHRAYSGPLANTPWDRLCTPEQTGDDFYTPADIVNAAREAMGGLDLDPASHWQANRIHRVPLYYHIHRSAFDNPWAGRVWLNPPYGDNAPWLAQILRYWDSGDITQLCMLSPVWVFTAQQARPIIARSSAMILLSPTPPFWGHPKGRTGTNHPHMILYLGDRVAEFHAAFATAGIPFRLLLNPYPPTQETGRVA